MSSVKISSLPIDRDTVEELKEKILELSAENEDKNENGEILENEYESNDEDLDDENEINERESTFREVAFLLDGIGMKKYIDIFKKENIDLNTFLSLTDKDLGELGISKKDRKTIMTNVGSQKEHFGEFIVDENHTSDYQILRNVQNHMTLLQNYCAYVECEMKRKTLTDYNITQTSTGTALTYFTKFAEAAIKQSEIISKLLYQPHSSDHLIGKLLEANKLKLPEDLEKKLVSRKVKKKKYPTRLFGVIGVSVVLIYAAKKLLKKIIN